MQALTLAEFVTEQVLVVVTDPSISTSVNEQVEMDSLLDAFFQKKLLERTPTPPLFRDLMALNSASKAFCRTDLAEARGCSCCRQHCRRGSDLKPLDEHELRSSLR